MVRVINEYIRANWEQIRADLALNGEHAGGGDAGNAIGEGFVDAANDGTPTPLLTVSSLFKIVIFVVEGPPVDFFVYTSYPCPKGV